MSHRVLVVDDEPLVLELTASMLAELGCDVITADDGMEALAKIDEDDSIEVMITDINMPGMNGFELADTAQRRHPRLRILVCSGSPFFIENLPPSLQQQVAFLQKPFVPKMLADAVQNLLQERPGAIQPPR